MNQASNKFSYLEYNNIWNRMKYKILINEDVIKFISVE